jgi:polysaccharide export outer membrane protein
VRTKGRLPESALLVISAVTIDMMRTPFRAALIGLALGFVFVPSAASQQRPQAAPPPGSQSAADVASRLQSIMGTTGMTAEQIRARLRGQGYSESLLDRYMPGAMGTDSLSIPDEDVFAAISALGIADSASVDTARAMTRNQRATRQRLDSAFRDSVMRALSDSSTRDALRAVLRNREAHSSLRDSGFQRFGASIFERASTDFDPNQAMAVGPNYRLGPGDRLVLVLTGDTERAYQAEVTRQGFIVIPEVGQISVSNLTLGQLEDILYTQLGRVYSGVRRGAGATTRFSLNVSRTGSNQVMVTGDVEKPGAYQVSRAGSVMTALYMAGGPSETGSMRSVQVRRAGATVAMIDLYDYALRGDASRNVALENGDIIFVPPKGAEVRIAGAILRPATYELVSGETLAHLIQMAGGFRPDADRRLVQIDRIVPAPQRTSPASSRRTIDIASELFKTAYGPMEPMAAGDVVQVFTLPSRLSNRIVVTGNVWLPGPVALNQGMELSDALRRAGGLKPDSYLGEVMITRLQPDSTRVAVRAALRDTLGTTVGSVPLQDSDEIRVFSVSDFRPRAYITISGAVKESGRIPYSEGMTLRQAIMLAGGLIEGALLTEAEIARIPESRANGVTALTVRVPMDSSYVFARGVDGRVAAAPGIPTRAGGAPEVVLQPYDAVLIMQQPNWQLQQIVTLVGEVRYPGPYAIRNRGERLADVIARAGGLTDNGYAGGVVFIRKNRRLGRVGLNLPAVLKNRRHSDNIELVDGDSIVIPRYEPIVRVRGAVNAPVAVAYVVGEPIDYYINAAGGGTSKADTRRAYVTQANGKVESKGSYLFLLSWEPKPQPGSTVIVPEKDPENRTDFTQILGTTASLLTGIVALIAITR